MPVKYKVRVHYDNGTVDFNAISRKDAVQEAERILVAGVWIDETKLYPANRITYIEILG